MMNGTEKIACIATQCSLGESVGIHVQSVNIYVDARDPKTTQLPNDCKKAKQALRITGDAIEHKIWLGPWHIIFILDHKKET